MIRAAPGTLVDELLAGREKGFRATDGEPKSKSRRTERCSLPARHVRAAHGQHAAKWLVQALCGHLAGEAVFTADLLKHLQVVMEMEPVDCSGVLVGRAESSRRC